MEENYTKLGQDLEKFEAPVDEKGWEAIANDPAVVKYRKHHHLRRAAIFGSAALLVAAAVTAVVLMTEPAKEKVVAQDNRQQTVTQAAVQEVSEVVAAEPQASVEASKSDAPASVTVSEPVKAATLTYPEAPVSSSKTTASVAEKPVLVQTVQQNTVKTTAKTTKSEQKTNNTTKSASSTSSNLDDNGFAEKTPKYSEPEPEDDFKMYIPTAFTPNGDGLNDLFTISANFTPAQFECTIFSRRGERVFYSKSLDNSWDGTKNGSVMPQNVYVYLIKYVDPNGKPCVEKGQVTLLLN